MSSLDLSESQRSIHARVAPATSQAIGVFDSGVGGLTVARAVLARLPHENLIYLGDTARVPYGSRSASTVLRYSRNAAKFLLQHQVKLILIACNTASAAALDVLSTELPVCVLGTVEPGAQAAAQVTCSGVVGVIGTLATVRSQAYVRALHAIDPKLTIHSAACPMLVPLVEEGWTAPTDPITELVVRRYLSELQTRAPELDTLVLGCTHYPLLATQIARISLELWQHPVQLVDSAQVMAEAAAQRLSVAGLLQAAVSDVTESASRLRCFVTDEARVAEVGARFLGYDLGRIEVVDL